MVRWRDCSLAEFFNQAVFRARLKGESSTFYRGVAQKQANETWGGIIVAAIIWYFASWGWATIGIAYAVIRAALSISASYIAWRLEKSE